MCIDKIKLFKSRVLCRGRILHRYVQNTLLLYIRLVAYPLYHCMRSQSSPPGMFQFTHYVLLVPLPVSNYGLKSSLESSACPMHMCVSWTVQWRNVAIPIIIKRKFVLDDLFRIEECWPSSHKAKGVRVPGVARRARLIESRHMVLRGDLLRSRYGDATEYQVSL